MIKNINKLYKNASVFPNKRMFLETYFSQKKDANVLDVGCYGQGFQIGKPDWPHDIIRHRVRRCVGIDIVPEVEELKSHGLVVHKMSAEDFQLAESFDVIYAGDIIEHLSNPGKFLECSFRHLAKGGELVVTTPNPYFTTSILQKLTYRIEPSVNPEHTCFYNVPTFAELISRYGLKILRLELLRRLDAPEQPPGVLMRLSYKIHRLVSMLTNKYSEIFVFIVVRDNITDSYQQVTI